MDPLFLGLILLLAFAISAISGLIGLTGGIVMAPALLFLPQLFGFPALDMKAVSGLTITQSLFGGIAGAIAHRRRKSVSRPLVVVVGGAMALAAFGGALLSGVVSNKTLSLIFAGLAIVGALLMLVPNKDLEEEKQDAQPSEEPAFHRGLAVAIGVGVGTLCGMVGQGGSFILIPLMLVALKLPTRMVLGSNLAIISLASLSAFVGKLWAGQISPWLALALVLGAIPGAQVGAALSHRVEPKWLRRGLALMVGLAAIKLSVKALS